LGCENKMAQPSPIHSWKLMGPCEVSAVKLGASSFMRKIKDPPRVTGIIHAGFGGSKLASEATC
jgi:hypothetical protein